MAKRDAPKIAEQIWHHPWPKGPQGRFTPLTCNYLAHLELLQEQAGRQEPAGAYDARRDSAERMVAASQGFDLATFDSFADFKTWSEQGPPKGSIRHYPNSGDQQYSMAAEPAPAAIAQQIYSQALMPKHDRPRSVQGARADRQGASTGRRSELEGYDALIRADSGTGAGCSAQMPGCGSAQWPSR